MKSIQIVTLSTTFLLLTVVVGLGLWSLTNRSPIDPMVGQVAEESRGLPNRPYVEPLVDGGNLLEVREDGSIVVVGVGPVSEFEAKDLVKNVPLKIPGRDVLPPGFSVRAIFYENSTSTYEFGGQEFSPEILRIYLWDRDLGQEVRASDLLGGGGISITMTYALGSNQSASELFRTMNRDLIYIDGFPTLVADGHIELFQFEENVSYDVIGNYTTDVLLRIMKSIIIS